MGFLKFLHEDILPFILKSDKAGFWEIIFFFFFFFFYRKLGKLDKFGPKAEYSAFYPGQHYFLCFNGAP